MNSEEQDLRDPVMQLRAEKEHLAWELALARPPTPNSVPEPHVSWGYGWFEQCMQCTLNMRNPACAFDAGRVANVVDSQHDTHCLQLPLGFRAEVNPGTNGGTVNDWLREHQMRLQTAFDGAKERIQAAARLRKEWNDQHVAVGSLTEDPAELVGPITSEYGEEQGGEWWIVPRPAFILISW
ncbi:hypothetical protein AAFF_G00222990 [Aldrovandia affinis]|uniref:Uncharacterized protein n=1 Tax=Aldrovandia affinis TaxID=143900 RepID=A0AAD7RFD3_9TELE|nr:hypothetical protein AAFF_G00222990 [Aldrovandia affinis]